MANELPRVVTVRRIGSHDLPLPSRAHEDDAGLDLRNAGPDLVLRSIWSVYGEDCIECVPGRNEPIWLPCGFAFAIPHGFEGQVRGRSGLARNHGVVAFHVGTIDASYRGEVCVGLINRGPEDFKIKHGDRIAQLVIAPVLLASCAEGDIGETVRGTGGFGSSGVK
jgi:dUTP pyrophosphatase